MKTPKGRFERKIALLNMIRVALGESVFDFTITTRTSSSPIVTFTRYPRVCGDQPSLKALESHVRGERVLTFDNPETVVNPHRHWNRPGRLASRDKKPVLSSVSVWQ